MYYFKISWVKLVNIGEPVYKKHVEFDKTLKLERIFYNEVEEFFE